jgi:hypothetical protein
MQGAMAKPGNGGRRRIRMLAVEAIMTPVWMIWAGGTAGAFRFPPPQQAAALTSEQTRQPAYNDFLRLIFADIAPPTSLGSPNAYRVFFGATAFYKPPIAIAQIANFSGIPVNSTVPLFALRCIPPPNSDAAPAIAFWPNLISAMLTDYETNPPVTGSADEAIQTIAKSFSDISSPVVTEALANALSMGEQFFASYPKGGPEDISAAAMQSQMSRRFGAFPAFTGLGYAAEGTQTSPSFDSTRVMQSMVIPDFILKNVTLAEADCHCVELAPTIPNRDQRKLDPDFISREGGDGAYVEADPWEYADGYQH